METNTSPHFLKKRTGLAGVHIVVDPVCYPFKTIRHRFTYILNSHCLSAHTQLFCCRMSFRNNNPSDNIEG